MITNLEPAQLQRAYAETESITREQARNFYYGIRLLSKQKRAALCAVYALARRVDDIGDGDLPSAEKIRQLAELRLQVGQLQAARESGAPFLAGTDSVLLALAAVTDDFPIPLGAFGELIDGVEMDVSGRHYETFEDLVAYCRCVAGSIGRLCLAIFGSEAHAEREHFADVLGIALQQTNILRDIREDLLNGRVYLAQADLDRFGVELAIDSRGALIDDGGGLSELIAFSADRARTWYREGLQLLPLLDRRSAACCAAMSGIYQQLLNRIEADPTLVLNQRLALSGGQKARVAVRALAGRPI